MANMSYCRFHNTKLALQDCLTALDPYENEYEISDDEVRDGIRMFEHFLGYCMDVGIIDEYNIEEVKQHFEAHNEEVRGN